MDIDALLAALAPHLLELIAALATAIIGWLAAQAKARWGLEIEARHREALHSALMTGVKHALSEGVQGRTAIAEAAVDYVHTSVPDALAALKPQPGPAHRHGRGHAGRLARRGLRSGRRAPPAPTGALRSGVKRLRARLRANGS